SNPWPAWPGVFHWCFVSKEIRSMSKPIKPAKPMTIKQAKAIVRGLGLTLVNDTEYGEFIVKLPGTRNDHSQGYRSLGHHQDHLEDAVDHARAWHARVPSELVRVRNMLAFFASIEPPLG